MNTLNFPSGKICLISPLDEYQAAAVEKSKRDSFVLQGPPGTGKSHTISCIIAEALSDGESVLLISEKTDALDVVYRELENFSLSDFVFKLSSGERAISEKLKNNLSLQPREDGNYFPRLKKFLSTADEADKFLPVLTRKRANGLDFKENLNLVLSFGKIPDCVHLLSRVMIGDGAELAEEKIMLLHSSYSDFGIEGELLPTGEREECLSACEKIKDSLIELRKSISAISSYGFFVGAPDEKKLKLFSLKGMSAARYFFTAFPSGTAEEKSDYFSLPHAAADRLRAASVAFLAAESEFLSLFGEEARRAPFEYLPLAENFLENADKFDRYVKFRRLLREIKSLGVSVDGRFFMLDKNSALSAYKKAVAKAAIGQIREELKDYSPEAERFARSRLTETENDVYSACRTEIFNRAICRIEREKRSPLFSRRRAELLARLYGDGIGLPSLFFRMADAVLSRPDEAEIFRGKKKFDIVIFDEASRISAQSGLPLFSLGRRVIIAGDEKQLPPSSFFNSDGERENILSHALRLGYPVSPLAVHYRSRNESLISFVNCRFYSGGLISFPSPVRARAVEIVRTDGIYENKKGNVNITECDAVINAVCRFLKDKNSLGKSAGIITLSASQRDIIQKRLSLALAREKLISRAGESRLTVRNIENVQGEERDVIFLSVGYGKNEDGKEYFRFGPINAQGGERRLNVALTRAREKLYVYCSLPDSFFCADLRSEGARALRDFLSYEWEEKISPPAESWQKCVGAQLESAGFSVRYNYGESSFKIPVAAFSDEVNAAVFLSEEGSYGRLRTEENLSACGWKCVFLSPAEIAYGGEITGLSDLTEKRKEKNVRENYGKIVGFKNSI